MLLGIMKFLTKAISAQLPALGTTSEASPDTIRVPLKIFNPSGAQTWYVTEYDPTSGQAFCYVTGMHEDEFGYVDLGELATIRGRFGLGMERDRLWDGEVTLADVMSGKKR